MKYSNYQQNPADPVSYYIYGEQDLNKQDQLDFLESQGVQLDNLEYVEFEENKKRHIWHENE